MLDTLDLIGRRYIPVPTGNAFLRGRNKGGDAVYPCTYRERVSADLKVACQIGISLYLQGTRAEC